MKKIVCFCVLGLLAGNVGVHAQVQKEEVKSNAADSLAYQREIELSEVSVVAAKPLIKAEVDKTVYNISDDPDSKTNTLLEMLRKVPFITVDSNDNIKVNGSSSFRIYMNGKPSGILSNNPKEALRSIPAHTIKKIEVITDPGARYDAEGVSGILNVITKGAEFEGYSADLNTMLMNKVQVAGGYATFKYGKFSLSANYSFSHYMTKIKSESFREQYGDPDETYLNQSSSQKIKTPGHYGGLEAGFEIDSLNLITLSGFLNKGRDKNRSDESYSMESSGHIPVYTYDQAQDNYNNWGNSSIKADYQRGFKRNKKEMLTLSYQYDYMPNDVDAFSTLINKEGDSPSLGYLANHNHQFNKARGKEHTLQLDYINPFTKRHSVEGGLKYIRRNNNSHAISEMKANETEQWQPSSFQPTLEYDHLQNIMAAYLGYTFNNERWGLNSGLRMEHTWQNVGYKQGNGKDFDYKATDWVPSLSLSYKLSDHHNLRLSYNLRLRRPGINYLNPYVLINGGSIRYGNPELESEKHHRIIMTHSYFTPRFNIQSTFLYATTTAGVGEYQFLDDRNILNHTYGNIEQVKGVGMGTYIGYNPSAKTTLSVNGYLSYIDMRVNKEYQELLNNLKNTGLAGSLFGNFSQKFGDGWRLVLSAGCGRQEITLGKHPELFYTYGGYISKSFMGDKLTVALRGQDFLQPYRKANSKQIYPDFRLTQKQRYYENTFGITVSYRFGELKESLRKVARSITNDDLMKSDK
ncbi:TonB-dependent receptor domain-containing protein [Parabacteroides sp.]